jgi:hypothetical protein
MRPVIALLILGSIVTSASAAGTEMHEIAREHAFQQQETTISRPMISGTFSRYRDFGRGAAGFGRW